jgi:hypothetical protein
MKSLFGFSVVCFGLITTLICWKMLVYLYLARQEELTIKSDVVFKKPTKIRIKYQRDMV